MADMLLVALLLALPPAPAAASEAARNCPLPAAASGEVFKKIDTMLADRREADGIPGLAAGIVCGSEPVWAKGYGVMALDDARPVTPQTRFRIASITKLFTATAILALVEDGVLGLDDPVQHHLDWFELRRSPDIGNEPVTIRQLLAHASGLPRDSSLTDFDRLYQPAREDAIAALPGQGLQSPPGESYAYSNLGYGVLGEVIAEASGMSYAEFLKQEVFMPLGMKNALVHPSPGDDVTWGHGPRGLTGSRDKAGFWELGFATPAGGMAASVEELADFMLLNLAPYAGARPRLLSAPVLRNMHDIHFLLDPERGGMGLGWAVEISNGQHLVYHGGELPEQTSFMLIDLHARVGIIVLTNAQDVDANGMAQEMLRTVRSALPGAGFPFPAIPRE